MSDARFEDGAARPLRLRAEDVDDLKVISALIQDAVFPGSEMVWRSKDRQFAILINRFRWEDKVTPPERVRAVLVFDDVAGVASQGLARDGETIYSLLALDWEPAADGAGAIILTLSGDGGLKLLVECLNVTLQDVTQPYQAPSGKAPSHPE